MRRPNPSLLYALVLLVSAFATVHCGDPTESSPSAPSSPSGAPTDEAAAAGAPSDPASGDTNRDEPLPPNPGPAGLYLGRQASIHPVVTPKTEPITWGHALPIDAAYGATVYAGTSIAMPDPRPPLADGKEPLRLWVAAPDNGLANRPAILWFHGGGFAVGIDAMPGLANTDGRAYAERGYVSFSVEYRIDTTLVGTSGGARPPSLCQWVQDNEAPQDPTWIARKDQCNRNILAAQRDSLAAVRWVRAHAAEYGVDPTRIAIAGFSAGAVLAASVAYQSEDVGDAQYFAGDDLSATNSRVQAAFGASGCLFGSTVGASLTTIGAGDAPVSLIHSELDLAVPYACAAVTVTDARAAGLVAELTSYCNTNGHADDLYEANKTATDDQWTNFLARELRLYDGMRAPSAAAVCR